MGRNDPDYADGRTTTGSRFRRSSTNEQLEQLVHPSERRGHLNCGGGYNQQSYRSPCESRAVISGCRFEQTANSWFELGSANQRAGRHGFRLTTHSQSRDLGERGGGLEPSAWRRARASAACSAAAIHACSSQSPITDTMRAPGVAEQETYQVIARLDVSSLVGRDRCKLAACAFISHLRRHEQLRSDDANDGHDREAASNDPCTTNPGWDRKRRRRRRSTPPRDD